MTPFPVESGKLEDYVTKNPSSKLTATPATSKFGCYEIDVVEKWPQPSGDNEAHDLRIYVDPKVGFWVRRFDRGPALKGANLGDRGTSIFEVQEFKDCSNGVFWPLRIRQKTRSPDRDTELDTAIHHSLHSINQPLPEKSFETSFPDWLIVHDVPTGRVFIWGPDEKPRMTFGSQSEFEEWNAPRALARMETGVPRRVRWPLIAGISIFVGLVLLFIMRRRNKAMYHPNTVASGPEGTSQSNELEGK